MKTFLRCVLLALTLPGHAFAEPASLKLITPAGYLTNIPVLVRIEALDATGAPDRELWDADVTLSASAGFTLSTNRIILRNGVGSGLVALSGAGSATVTATLGALSANRTLASLSGAPVTPIGGSLSGNTTWTGIIRITNTVTVPAGTTLTIQSNTLVLIDGVEATRLLRREHASMAVIGISVRNDPQVKLAMTEAGAADFLPKESAAGQLYDIILRHCPVASSAGGRAVAN